MHRGKLNNHRYWFWLWNRCWFGCCCIDCWVRRWWELWIIFGCLILSLILLLFPTFLLLLAISIDAYFRFLFGGGKRGGFLLLCSFWEFIIIFLSECKVAVRSIKISKTSRPSSKNVPLPHPDKNNPEALSQLYKMMNYKPTSNKG